MCMRPSKRILLPINRIVKRIKMRAVAFILPQLEKNATIKQFSICVALPVFYLALLHQFNAR